VTKTLLALGQSNMQGHEVGGAFSISGSVTAWNNEASRADSLVLGSSFVACDVNSNPFNANNNLAAHAASLIATLLSQSVRLILSARPGTLVSTWINDSGVAQQQYTRLVAVLAAASVSAVDYVLWDQGESDVAGGLVSGYANTFGLLVSRLQSDGYISASTPIVVGQMAPNWPTLNPVLETISRSSSRIAVACIGALPTVEGTHFIGSTMPVAARRFIEALSGLDSAFNGIWPA
jgi:hypothetical protein